MTWQIKKWVPSVALVLLAASIVYASSKVEFKKDESANSQWMIYSPGPHNAGSAAAELNDSPSVVKSLYGDQSDNSQGFK